ncbi:MAG: hypothetical protein ACRDRZ_06975 [Pseudonocardiaceae bacterium]
MLYLLAAIGAGTTALLLWKAFGPQRPIGSRRPVLAPDDDPDFMRKLNRRPPPDPDQNA